MTAHRRTRKQNNKRSTTDVDPYTLRYRAASDAAKAARAAARSRAEGAGGASGEGLGREAQADGPEERVEEAPVRVINRARIKSVSLVREGGTGYIEVDSRELGYSIHAEEVRPEDLEFKHAAIEFEVPADIDWSSVSDRPLVFDDVDLKALEAGGRVRRGIEEALRSEAAPHAEAVGQRGAEGASEVVPEDAAPEPAAVGEAHLAFFEAEVNGLPTHVDTQDCTCEIGEAHWIEVGEN